MSEARRVSPRRTSIHTAIVGGACAVAVVAGFASVSVGPEPRLTDWTAWAVPFSLCAVVAAVAGAIAGAHALSAGGTAGRSELERFVGCVLISVGLAGLIVGLYWLVYVLTFAVGWEDHDWSQFEENNESDNDGLKIAVFTFLTAAAAVAIGVPVGTQSVVSAVLVR